MGLLPSTTNTREEDLAKLAVRHKGRVFGGNEHVGLRQDHLEIVEGSAEERPRLQHLFEETEIIERLHGVTNAIPAREHDASLSPAEDPWDGAQVLDTVRIAACCGARADLEIGNLAQRG